MKARAWSRFTSRAITTGIVTATVAGTAIHRFIRESGAVR